MSDNQSTKRNAHWDNDPAGYDQLRASWLNDQRDLWVERFLVQAPPAARVLEIGSGTGTSLVNLARKRSDLQFVGVEPLAGYVEYAREKQAAQALTNLQFVTGCAEDIDQLWAGPSVDFVVSTDVIHHFRDVPKALRALSQVVRKGARWLAIEPSWLNPYIFYFQAFTPGERNFFPKPFLTQSQKNGWQLAAKQHSTLIPAFIKQPPPWLIALERTFERLPVVSGRVGLELEYQGT